MIHAYQEIYVDRVQKRLGEAFDYAINTYGLEGSVFASYFVASSYSKGIEKGNIFYISGKSGIEIALSIIEEATGKYEYIEEKIAPPYPKEYWVGWALAYYQWYSNRSFDDIFYAVSYEELERMFYTLHEADITKFSEMMDSRVKDCFPETVLKRKRTSLGYSQKKLAEESGVSLRSIQMYEERYKDINKASVETLYKLALVIGCDIESLLEK